MKVALIIDPLHEAAVDTNEPDRDDMVANIEKDIRDLPVGKDLVARVGLKEARNFRRQGLIVQRITVGNPQN